MSQCVVVNEGGELYGGFSSEASKPIWFKTKRADCVIDCSVAALVVKQLHGLGFTKVAVRPAEGVIRKWVPADLDATSDFSKAA